jgi:membrane protein implicated in regulation of membrane protease activity
MPDSPDHPEYRPVRHKWDERVHCVDSLRQASQTNAAMIDHFALKFRRRFDPARHWLIPLFGGFLYWLVFLLVLEPDNVLRASQAGYVLPLGRETARIIGAAILGATVTPLLTSLSRRIPLAGAHPWRHAAIHLVCVACLALLLIVASCFLAAWGFERQVVPSLAEVNSQLASNWTLLVFALCAFTAISHLIRLVRRTDGLKTVVTSAGVVEVERSDRIPIKTGGRLRFVEQSSIDWLETQGNYLALHFGSNKQLVRRTLTDFETELDMNRFIRIHRRIVVAINRIEEMKPLANGDAMLRLRGGHELRMSRSYRDEVMRRWAEGGRSGDRLARDTATLSSTSSTSRDSATMS